MRLEYCTIINIWVQGYLEKLTENLQLESGGQREGIRAWRGRGPRGWKSAGILALMSAGDRRIPRGEGAVEFGGSRD